MFDWITKISLSAVLWACLSGHGFAAEHACEAFGRLQQIYDLQMQIISENSVKDLQDEVRQLRRQLNVTTDLAIIDAIEDDKRNERREIFRRFLYNSRYAMQSFNGDDPMAAHLYYRAPQIRNNLMLVGFYLSNLTCDDVDEATTSGFSTLGQSRELAATDTQMAGVDHANSDGAAQSGQKMLQEKVSAASRIKRALVGEQESLLVFGLILMSSSIFAVGLIIVTLQTVKALLLRRRRRARRFPAQYETISDIDGKKIHGVLHDISGQGTKFGHDLDTPVEIKTPISVQIFDEWYEGTVAWSNEHYAGIMFRRPLKNKTVRAVHTHIAVRNYAQM